MNVTVAVGVALLGGLGAVARVVADQWVSERAGGALPFGILAVNVSGALALGAIAGAGVHGDALRLFGGGLLGGYTTFSTWMLQTHTIARAGQRHAAALNVVLSVALGVAAVAAGRTLA
jgi:CrcB protein